MVKEISEVFKSLNNLAEKGFEFFLGGVGFALICFGLLINPSSQFSEVELIVMLVNGFLILIGACLIWVHKIDLRFKAYMAQIEYNKFVEQNLNSKK